MVIGNPVDILIGQDCDGPCREKVIRSLGLHLPLHEQYLVFLKNALKGELGNSFKAGIPATHLILQRMPATLELAFCSFLIAVGLGIPLGIWAGLRPESLGGKVITGGSILGFSLPSFWVGVMLMLLFAVELNWLPATGRGETVPVLGVEVSFLTLDGLRHLILPAVNLALFKLSLMVRLTRASVRENLLMDYIKFARAKGLSMNRIIFVHVLKNILIPIITVLGLELGNLIAFSVVTETIFAWPGMGKLLIDSIDVLDRPVVVAYLMITIFMFIMINLVVDILYSLLDPRVRLGDIKQ
jgi:peptide/nickel transport system permease protein